MKKGTIQVRKGQKVEAGEILGQVGFSGRTQFPHLHLSVRKAGKVVDPFEPDGKITCGTPDPNTLWQDTIPYVAGGVLNAGFQTEVPSFDDIKQTGPKLDLLPRDAPALVLWAYAFGSRAGDQMTLLIQGPDGPLLSRTVDLTKTQAQFFRAVGKRGPADGFQPGTYTGHITLLRDGKVIDETTTTTTVR